jgi:hypothetical protein
VNLGPSGLIKPQSPGIILTYGVFFCLQAPVTERALTPPVSHHRCCYAMMESHARTSCQTSNLIPHHTKYQYTHNRVHSQYHFHTKTQQPEKARIRIDWVQTHSTLNYIPSSSSLHTYHTSSTSTAFSHSWVLITPIFYFLKPLPLAV